MTLEWGGDVDLGDGKLQLQHEEYFCRVRHVKAIVRNFSDLHQRSLTISDLMKVKESLEDDLSFIPKGL